METGILKLWPRQISKEDAHDMSDELELTLDTGEILVGDSWKTSILVILSRWDVSKDPIGGREMGIHLLSSSPTVIIASPSKRAFSIAGTRGPTSP